LDKIAETLAEIINGFCLSLSTRGLHDTDVGRRHLQTFT